MDIRFTASQSVDIPVVEQPVPIQHYLRQPQRLVRALASSSRIEHLGSDLFRLKMRPLFFMMLSLQPTVDMNVWAESDGTVRLRSRSCEILGVEYINERFALNLSGQLQPRTVSGMTHLRGRADLEVMIVDLPPPFLFTPRPILETTGNGLLKSVLLTVKQRLVHQLVSDYQLWANTQSLEETPLQSGVLLPNNSPTI
jgi:hypothetical protein